MLRKIKNICLMMMFSLAMVFIAGCCDTSITVNIDFEGVDSALGHTDYVEELKAGDSVSLEFNIPAGYDHEGFNVLLNNKYKVEWTVEYSNPDIEEEYRYTVAKKITFSISKLIEDCTINIDFTSVKKRELPLKVSSSILNITGTKNENGGTDSNLSIISINPDNINKLLRLDSSNILEKRDVIGDTGIAYYGEYVALCYTKPNSASEINTLYTDVNHFTNSEDILTLDTIRYCKYDVAKKGNSYYNVYTGALANTSTRIFYLGLIQEGFNIYNKIPTYVAPQGFNLEDEENKFSLLTNLQEFNSDLLSINVYKPTNKAYDESDTSIDKVGDVVLEKISPLDEEFVNRYNRYDMYIGDDITNDIYLEDEERTSLPNELYVSIQSEINANDGDRLDNYLNVHLLHYEKQSEAVSHYTFSDYLESDKNVEFLKIDSDVISQYLDYKSNSYGAYTTGNAILYVELDDSYVDTSRINKTFAYTAINYPVYHNGSYAGIDYSYDIQMYILNEDGSKDYGFLDLQKYPEDIVYFRTDKLYTDDEYNQNLYINIVGPDYDSYHSPIITRIYVKRGDVTTGVGTGVSVIPGGFKDVEDVTTLNGAVDLLLNLGDKDSGDQYPLSILLITTTNTTDRYAVDFTNLQFNDLYYDSIYVTNNSNISSALDFYRIGHTTKSEDYGIMFGRTTEIYYFVATTSAFSFDLYAGENSDDNRITSSTKLLDIAGNTIRVSLNGTDYEVYVMYQSVPVYGKAADTYLAYNYTNSNE